MLLLVVRPEDRELERARLLLPEDILGVDAERDRDVFAEGATITIPLEVGTVLSG